MAILKHIASKSSNYGAALEYLIFKHANVNFCIRSICCRHPERA